MRQIEILHNIVPNLRQIYPIGKKTAFLAKQAHTASWQPKKLIERLKSVGPTSKVICPCRWNIVAVI